MKQILLLSALFLLGFFHSLPAQNASFEWVLQPDGTSSNNIYDVKTDSAHNIYLCGHYITGFTYGGQQVSNYSRAAYVMKLDSAHNLVWFRDFPDSENSQNRAHSLVLDDVGDVYVSGTFRADYQTLSAMFDNIAVPLYSSLPNYTYTYNFVLKYSSSGTIQWVHVGGESYFSLYANNLAYKDGSIYYVSSYRQRAFNDSDSTGMQFGGHPLLPATGSSISTSDNNTFAARITTGGNVQWVKSLATDKGTSTSSNFGRSGDVVVDDQGDIYFTTISSYDMVYDLNDTVYSPQPAPITRSPVIVKINDQGQFLTSFFYENASSMSSTIQPGLAAINNSVYMVYGSGAVTTFAPGISASGNYILKLNSNLQPLQAQTLVPGTGTSSYIYDFKSTSDDQLKATGRINGVVSFSNKSVSASGEGLFMKFDTNFSTAAFLMITEHPTMNSSTSGYGITEYYDDSYIVVGNTRENTMFGYQEALASNFSSFIARIVDCQPLNVSVSPDTALLCGSGATVTLTANGPAKFDYKWLTNNQPITGAIQQTYTTNNNGFYRFWADSAGCRDTSDVSYVTSGTYTSVNVSPQSQNICETSAPIALTGGTPAGGAWVGPGVVNNTHFDPSLTGQGTHVITYTYSDPSGCADSAFRFMNVQAAPAIFIQSIDDFCTGDAPEDLSNKAVPAGGTFTGPGMQPGNIFHPDSAGVGSHVLTYTYTGASSCQGIGTVTVNVSSNPNVTVNPFPSVCENIFNYPLSGGSPAGGTWSGTQVTVGSFFPLIAGAGVHQVTYTVTQNGCTGSATENITVDPATATISAPSNLCVDGAPVVLQGVPSGGTFVGPGIVNDSLFDPAVTGDGTFTVGYAIDNSCGRDTAFANITVDPLPQIIFGSWPVLCESDTAYNLTASPSGGIFSGTAVSGDFFDPGTAGAGIHTITYSYQDANGCDNVEQNNIEVIPKPTVSFVLQDSICLNSGTLNLTGGTPSGGSYSGPGVSGGTFDPAIGSGTYSLVYSYTDPNGCIASDTQDIVVYDTPDPVWSGPGAVCINAGLIPLSGASPAGGTFSGNGVSGSDFDPAVAGSGTHTVTYSIMTSCGQRSATDDITVNPLPSVSLSPFNDVCESLPPLALSGGTPSGGTFSGTGVSANHFDPGAAGAGTHTIVYSYTDGAGCSNNAQQTITVIPKPSVSFSLQDSVCVNAASVSMTGNPSGGTFNGAGVSGSNFDPSVAGIGTVDIVYSYIDAAGCTGSDTQQITVFNTSDPVWAITDSICIDAGTLALTGASPSGGTFSGPGVTGSDFEPSAAGTGTHTVTYTINTACGSRSTSHDITVSPVPAVTLNAFADVCENQTAFTLTGGNPAGGTYSGSGVINNSFDPVAVGTGTHTISYSFTNGFGCSDTAQQTITVTAAPQISFGIPDSVCVNAAPLTLSASPSGGTFSGTGVSGNNFDPSAAGQGTVSITYSVTNASGCSSSQSKPITVYDSPDPAWTAPGSVCEDAGIISLGGGTPSGGTFSGTGVSGSDFDPAVAGSGTHTVTYSISTSCGIKTVSDDITVNPSPTVTLSSLPDVCENAGIFALSGGSPAGGTYSGTGVTNNVFDPVAAGTGTFTITYEYTDAAGCTETAVNSITVNAVPSVSFSFSGSYCEDDPSVTLSGGSPAGGTYFGTGVTGNSFDPQVAGAGSHTVSYAYTNTSGCADTASVTLAVNSVPGVSFSVPGALCLNDNVVSLSGVPSGGTFSGNGVTGNTFDPSAAGAGLHPVTYTYTDANGCTGNDVQNIEVHALPAVTLAPIGSLCSNDAPLTLPSGVPSGGVFSGTGITGNTFDPATAGAGMFDIVYTYTDANGCVNSDTQSVEVFGAPGVTLDPLPEVCSNDNAFTLTGGSPVGGAYSGMHVVNNVFDPGLSGSGNFWIYYSYTNTDGCSGIDSAQLTVFAAPMVTLSSPDTLCEGDSIVTLNGLPSGGTFAGSGVTGNTFDPASVGMGIFDISYTFIDSDGCSGSDTNKLTVGDLPDVTVDDEEVCSGDAVTLTASGADVYSWSSGESGSSITLTPQNTAEFTVVGTNEFGCSAEDSAVVTVHDLPEVFIGNDTVICIDREITLAPDSDFSSYLWSTGHTTKSVTISGANQGIGDHHFYLAVTDNNGCEGSDTIVIGIDVCSGIAEKVTSDAEVIVYPNPSNGNFNLDFNWPGEDYLHIKLVSMQGQLVKESRMEISSTRQQYEFEASSMTAPGTYFLIISGERGNIVKRIVVGL